MPNEEVLTGGTVEKIGFEDAVFTIKVNGGEIKKVLPTPDHARAISILLEALAEYKIVSSLDEITGAGYHAIHGGETFKEGVLVTENVVKRFASLNGLTPLHNPAGLVGYNTFKNNLPNCKHVFMSDTALHSTMPKEPYIYALPMRCYDKYKIRRYGFHGTSHKYVSSRYAELMNKKVEDTKTATYRLENGAGITAIDGGKSINTSIDFTSLAGVMMGTRCGDIDSAIVTYIVKKTGAVPGEMDDIMNIQSGMLDVSGISSGAHDIEDGCKEGNLVALLTTEIYVNRVINVIGDYYVQPDGADATVFTGEIGENDTNIRRTIYDRLSVAFSIQLDEELNEKIRGKEALLLITESEVAVRLVPTSEELMIVRDTYRLIA